MANLKETDTEELGQAVDMIKDLEEAIYYCTITKAMEKSEKEENSSPTIVMPSVTPNTNNNTTERYYYTTPYYPRDYGRYDDYDSYGRMYYQPRNSDG